MIWVTLFLISTVGKNIHFSLSCISVICSKQFLVSSLLVHHIPSPHCAPFVRGLSLHLGCFVPLAKFQSSFHWDFPTEMTQLLLLCKWGILWREKIPVLLAVTTNTTTTITTTTIIITTSITTSTNLLYLFVHILASAVSWSVQSIKLVTSIAMSLIWSLVWNIACCSLFKWFSFFLFTLHKRETVPLQTSDIGKKTVSLLSH